MKKVILLLMIAAVVFSCKKTENPSVQYQSDQMSTEVSFNINKIFPQVNRTVPDDLPECSEAEPYQAHIVIKNFDKTVTVYDGLVLVFTLPDGNLYTQAIKLMLEGCVEGQQCCNEFWVTEFYLLDAAGNIIYAAPAMGSPAQGWLDYPERQLDLQLIICEFMKYQYDIDVLCYQEAYYEEFGFVWFQVHEVILCQVCFFADVCLTTFPPDTPWEPYYTPMFDMIGIFGITAEKLMDDGSWQPVEGLQNPDGTPKYTNYNWDLMEYIPGPLCVPFANYLEKVDTYQFYWWVWLPDGNGDFCWRIWQQGEYLTIEDDCDYSAHTGGADGVIELMVNGGGDWCLNEAQVEWFTPTLVPCVEEPDKHNNKGVTVANK